MRADDRAIDDKIRMPLFVVFGRPMVCALSALGLGRSVVIYVNVGSWSLDPVVSFGYKMPRLVYSLAYLLVVDQASDL
jgi:hypothetical protein